ncbi:MAG: hypothetical protein R3E31_06110 [Chloroflexota bacterium]
MLAQITAMAADEPDAALFAHPSPPHAVRLPPQPPGNSLAKPLSTLTAAMPDRWQTHAASGTPIDVDAEMMQVTLEIVGKTL